MRIGFQNGYYGTLHYDGKKKIDVFTPCGREITLNRIYESIEKDCYTFQLKFPYGTSDRTKYITRGVLEDPTFCKELVDAGMDVKRKQYDVFAESIRVQEDQYFLDNTTPNYCYNYLGWVNTTLFSADGSPQWCYKSNSIITPVHATMGKYLGNFKITPMGKVSKWIAMVKKEVLPYTPMSIVLLASLSAVIIPLLSVKYPIGNGILHLCAVSSSGKTTAAYLATSIAGEPFTVVRTEIDEDNRQVLRSSLMQSFSATENALLGKLTGLNGVPLVLDELGKYRGKDMQSLIFDLFDGNSKSRMSTDLTVSELPGFKGSIITIGETSILKKCSAKLEGLYNRVFEMKSALTVSAKQSDTIKKVCAENNGMIASFFATYIAKNGNVDMIAEIYDAWVAKLQGMLPQVKFVDKFICNFPAVYLTTAEIAKKALGLNFDTNAIIQYFADYLSDDENSMDISSKSYDYLMKEFASNNAHFYEIPTANNVITSGTVWGRYESKTRFERTNKFGKKIIGEYSVRENILDKLLIDGGYTKAQCVKAWKEQDLIDYYEGKNCCRRIIDVNKGKEKVYVFYELEDEVTKNAS